MAGFGNIYEALPVKNFLLRPRRLNVCIFSLEEGMAAFALDLKLSVSVE
jgi:hypothetical protein